MIVVADNGAIEEAARILRGGGLVAFPTETVYGLGADATDGQAVARIFEAKGRPRFNPLIVHAADLDTARDLADFNGEALALAEKFWPGPLTLVLPLRAGASISDLVTAGLGTVAIRVPAHPAARRLLAAAGVPVAAPSANISGRVSPTCARQVEEDLGGKVDMILDGGSTEAGLESTIVAPSPRPTLLRPGGLAREAIETLLGCRLQDFRETGVRAPGQLASHYAPRATLRLDAEHAGPGEVLLGFGPQAPENVLNLSRAGDLREAAANLFAYLRDLDAEGPGQFILYLLN
ncbi:MAG: threonylcarbamoyl-AMP synthase [Rhodomicrobium sp.]|nr:threonylcarbamoyl-AMP synthase [Rhodomicrobium sp.]